MSLAGGRRRWAAAGPVRRDGPKRHGGRREDEGPRQRKEEGAADGLDEEIRAVQQLLRRSPPRTLPNTKGQRHEAFGALSVDEFVLRENVPLTTQIVFFLTERTKIPHTTEDVFVPGIKCDKRGKKTLYDGSDFLSRFRDSFNSYFSLFKVLTDCKNCAYFAQVTLFIRKSILKRFPYVYFYQMGVMQASFHKFA